MKEEIINLNKNITEGKCPIFVEISKLIHKYKQIWLGMEIGINNSSTRNMSKEEYYELNKKEWLTKAVALLENYCGKVVRNA